MPFDDTFTGAELAEGGEDQPVAPAVVKLDQNDKFSGAENPGGFFRDEDLGAAEVDPARLTPPEPEAIEATEPVEEKPPEQIPLAVLLEERRRRQAAEQSFQAQAEVLARIDERLRIAQEREAQLTANAEAATQDPPPDRDEDPIGYDLWEMKQYMKAQAAEIQSLRGVAGQAGEAFQRQELDMQTNAVSGWVQAAESEYRAKDPDYDAKLRFVRRHRAEELQAMGYTDPAVVTKILLQEQGMLINGFTQFDQAGRPVGLRGNPCLAVSELAKKRGFQEGVTKVDESGRVVGSAAGTGAGAPVDARARLGNVQSAARQSPGGRGGTASDSALTAAKIASMTETEINQLLSTARGRRLWDVAMGARQAI